MSSADSLESSVRAAFAESLDNFMLPGVGWRLELGNRIVEGVHGKASNAEGSPPLTEQQCWHWGSCTKALSATMIAILVDAGTFADGWDTALSKLLPIVSIKKENDKEATEDGGGLAAISLKQLAQHRGGVHDLDAEVEKKLQEHVSVLSAGDQRIAYIEELAKMPLRFRPGNSYLYSNAAYVLLSAAAEAATGTTWEQLITTRIAAPLGMESLRFGVPKKDASGRGAVGHTETGEATENEDELWHQASFAMHSTLTDWAKFASVHLKVLRGDLEAMRLLGIGPESAALLQHPASARDPSGASLGLEAPMGYAMGWQTVWEEALDGSPEPLAGPTGILWHSGTNFSFNSTIYMQAEPPMILLAGVNSGSALAKLLLRTAFETVLAIVQKPS